MRLRCLAGRYAGQIQDYSPFAGMSALRTGMAERLTDSAPPMPVAVPVAAASSVAPVASAAPVSPSKRRK